jgi:hypothetical protein
MAQIRQYKYIYKEHICGVQISKDCRLCEEYKEKRWHCDLIMGDKVDVQDRFKKWCEAVVVHVDINTHRVFIHYLGWAWSYNEWISLGSPRIERAYMMVKNWRDDIVPGYPVEIIHNNKWYVAVVTSMDAKLFSVTAFLQYNFRNKFSSSRCGVKKIIKNICTDSEIICKKGMHIKLTNYKMWEYVGDYWEWYKESTVC